MLGALPGLYTPPSVSALMSASLQTQESHGCSSTVGVACTPRAVGPSALTAFLGPLRLDAACPGLVNRLREELNWD